MSILSASLATREARTLYEGDRSIRHIAIDETHVYAIEESNEDGDPGSLIRVPKSGGPREVLGPGIIDPAGLEVLDEEVFVLDRGPYEAPEPKNGRVLRWTEISGLEPLVEDIEGAVLSLMVNEREILVRSETRSPELRIWSRKTGAMDVRILSSDALTLAGDVVLHTQAVAPDRQGMFAHALESGANTLIGTVEAHSQRVYGLVATESHAYFALNTYVGYGYIEFESEPMVFRMGLDGGEVERLPYDAVAGSLTARAFNDSFVAFGRTVGDSSTPPFDYDVVLFCRDGEARR